MGRKRREREGEGGVRKGRSGQKEREKEGLLSSSPLSVPRCVKRQSVPTLERAGAEGKTVLPLQPSW